MKYVLLLLSVAVIYYFLTRSSPIAPVAQTVAAQEVAPLTTGSREAAVPASTALKRPFDRTHAVLDQVKQRNGNGEF
jgi:hypothetical protein